MPPTMGPNPRKKIIIVRTGEPVPRVAETRGQFAALIQQATDPAHDGDWGEIDARRGDFPSPTAADTFVITGSSANVPNREPWMLETEAWLREIVGAKTPTFGICFGHQILAQALGGEVQKNPRGREMGTLPIDRHADDPIFEGLPARFLANVSHVDTVVRLPKNAIALARSAREEHQVIRFTETCYGVQYHPEFDAEVMRGYIASRREILEGEGFDVDAMLGEVDEASLGRRTLQDFVKIFLR